MGLNYYLHPSRNPLHRGGNPYPFQPGVDFLHIGKSSGGWCFALHIYRDLGINSLEDWKPWLHRHRIEDEYGRRVRYDDLMEVITDRAWASRPEHFTPEFLAQNHALPGPHNLLRRRVDGTYCVGSGAGTWDLCAGDFS